jgi:sugar/nucleoside kinase (ribokinase family)
VLGGSAVYFTLAAAQHARVHVNGIVGQDAVRDFRAMLGGLPVDLNGIVVGRAPTMLWHAVHDFDRWVTSSESEEPGCDPEWRPRLSAESAAAHVLFLASMHPRLQREVLAQSRARLIAADSMTVYMRDDAPLVRSVAEAADILFLNDQEVETLTGIPSWRDAALSLCGQGRLRAVVVKQGPAGAACVTRDRVIEAPAHSVARVVDPTGAGDALAGGFLGWCAEHERDDAGVFADALSEGTRCAAAAVTTFGTEGLADLSAAGASGPADV